MPPPVYVTITHTVPRHVRCEHCGEEYVYELTRTGMGVSEWYTGEAEEVAGQRAADKAAEDLSRAISTEAEAVPCPACRKYQDHMAAAARQLRWGWVKRLGSWCLTAMPVVTGVAVVVAVVASPGDSRLPFVVGGATAAVFLAV